MLKIYLHLLISMVPLIELRGAVPVSQVMGLPIVPSFIVCIIANMLPVPIIYLLQERCSSGEQTNQLLESSSASALKRREGRQEASGKSRKRSVCCTLLFVGIPLPGTGAWTGTLAASILDMDFKSTVAAVMLGVLLAGMIMMIVSLAGVSIFL